ncbi:MAG: hypothetical protein EOO38_10610, partial [Cytophagaceae bacterium]
AALLALRGNNQINSLSRALAQVAFAPDAPVYRARFYATGTAVDVFIDDQLPTKDTSDGICGGKKAPVSFKAAEGNYYVPLFEKAWAKYVDAHLLFASGATQEKDAHGYLVLESMPAKNVLRGVTGRARKMVYKTTTKNDYKFLQAIIDCLNGPQTCVFGSADANHLAKTLGPPNKFNVYPVPGGRIFRDNKVTYTLLDKDQSDERVTIVGNHAYALMRSQSPGVLGAASFEPNEILITIRNPWGCNPDSYSDGTCTAEDGDILISLRGLAAVMDSIYTLQ